jgi:hypothetical protein
VFQEVTEEWGLADIGAAGMQLNIVHLDGDDRPDLIVRFGDRPFVLHNIPGGFEEVTEESGLIIPATGPVASGDVDGDGDIDVYAPQTVPDAAAADRWSEVWLNDGDGFFVAGPSDSDARFEGRRAAPAGATLIDVDLDGILDLWVTQFVPAGANQALQDDLLLGVGDGAFNDATFRSGLATSDWTISALNQGRAHSNAWSGAACDLNGDGWPELLASSYGRQPNHLWQASGDANAGTVRFENRSVASGYAFDERTAWQDNVSAQCHCRDNPRDAECADVPNKGAAFCTNLFNAFGGRYRWNHAQDRNPFRLGGNSSATVCVDIDNDGDIDLLTGEIRHSDVGSTADPAELLVNTGEADVRFERPGNDATGLKREWPFGEAGELGWDEGAMTMAVLDFDNDGRTDIYWGLSEYPGNKGTLFHQLPDQPGKFRRVETADMFEHLRSHGVVSGDFDRDGDMDIIVGHSRSRCGGECYETHQIRAFENLLGQDGNWVRLRLEGNVHLPDHQDEATNFAAIGARVRVTTPDGVTQTQEVDGGHGHFNSQKDLALHFGLGTHCTAKVEIRWPNRDLTTQTINVQAGYSYRVPMSSAPIATNKDL